MSSSFSGGFLRDDSTGAVVVGATAPVAYAEGFLRDANGALVVVSSLAPSIQTSRTNAGALAAGSNADIVITWPVPFADNNYTITATWVDTTNLAGDTSVIRHVLNQSPTGCTVRVGVGTTSFTSGQIFIHTIAIHD